MPDTTDAISGIPQLIPPAIAEIPPYSYVYHLVQERDKLYGIVTNPSGNEGNRTSNGNAGGNMSPLRSSFDLRTRELRYRRQMRVEPRVPRNYRKTTQSLRFGQAMLSDFGNRVPALLAAKPYQVVATPAGDDEDSQDQATNKEDWTHALILGLPDQKSALDIGVTSVWRDWIDNLVNTGQGHFSLTARYDRWGSPAPGFPRREQFSRKEGGENSVGTGGVSQTDNGIVGTDDDDGERRYKKAVEAYHKAVTPFVMENLDPTSVHVREDDEGIEDEAIVVGWRPYRETLIQWGLRPAPYGYQGDGVTLQKTLKGNSGREYVHVEWGSPEGFGRLRSLNEWPIDTAFGSGVQCVTYYCSPRRARFLGLLIDDDLVDADMGVWAQYVDGICVQVGTLWGPPFHPLPIFRAMGMSTAMPDPAFRGVPAMLTLVEAADALDQIATMKMHIAYWSAWPPLLEEDIGGGGIGATGLPQDALINPEAVQQPNRDRSAETRVIQPAGFYTTPAGKRWRYLTLPTEATTHLQALEEDVKGLLDLLGLPSVFRGQGSSGQPGYAIAQLMVAARSLFDTIVQNSCGTVQKAVQYSWWQVWKRFPEGVPVYVGGDSTKGKKKGWITLKPQDIAPDWESKRNPGTPFLQCSVKAEPLLPVDEAQLEDRGIRAVQAGMVDEDSAREKYFGDPAPEKTAARILADQTLKDPVVVATIVTRNQVRMGLLQPELAPLILAAKLGIDPEMAAKQLAFVGGLSPEQEAALAQQIMLQQMQEQQAAAQAQMQAMGGMGQGMPGQLQPPAMAGSEPIPGVPGVPTAPPAYMPQPYAPAPPQSPGIHPGAPIAGVPSINGGQPQQQPTTNARTARMLAG